MKSLFPSCCLSGLINSLLAPLMLCLAVSPALRAQEVDPPNTQAESIPFVAAEEAARRMKFPDGFEVSLFASEPEVQQPIAMTFDPRGRLWIAENYTYSDRDENFNLGLNDAICVFEDIDADGIADRKRTFYSKLKRLTSIEYGFGGVWALAPPYLYFIPDEDGDDQPDAEPIVMLEGWDASDARHNFANGLKWGPDGWLYGRHGIMATSMVGTPDTPSHQRTAINCGIWRFHPIRNKFEVVCHGTTNSWGMDWDRHGELFFINTVIGHLWHAIPGAHFERMYGADFNPHLYELMKQTADHVHWDESAENWTAQKNGLSPGTDLAGGGHAHSGMMIYQGTNWPAELRDELFTLNFHGRRINREHLRRSGTTYVGEHRDDLMLSDDPWFRGIELGYGPNGEVYILDWSDIGECHENDGVHRTSGRIYCVNYRAAENGLEQQALKESDLGMEAWAVAQLVATVDSDNEWMYRQSRRILQERYVADPDLAEWPDVIAQLWDQVDSAEPVENQLRALWMLNAIGGCDSNRLAELLDNDNDEHLIVWAIRLLMEQETMDSVAIDAIEDYAVKHDPGLVSVYLSASLQRMPVERRLQVAGKVLASAAEVMDERLSLMLWYGVEAAITADFDATLRFLSQVNDPRLARFIARRMASDYSRRNEAIARLTSYLIEFDTHENSAFVLQGMAAASNGWKQVDAPARWSLVVNRFHARESETVEKTDVLDALRLLSVVFGEGRALEELVDLVGDANQDPGSRRMAIRAIVDSAPQRANQLLSPLVADRVVGADAVRGLGRINPPDLAETLMSAYPRMRRLAKLASIETMASIPSAAEQLLNSIESGAIDRGDVPAFVIRQLQLLGDEAIANRVVALWPGIATSDAEKVATANRLRDMLTAEAISAGAIERGAALFEESCGRCHRLFGKGGEIGPELTGGQRGNLTYWLDNLLDPSAEVANDFRMSILVLVDGRVLNGVIVQEFEDRLLLRTPTEEINVPLDSIDERRSSRLSLMPEGLLQALESEQEIIDLFAYLMQGTVADSSIRTSASERTPAASEKHYLYVAEPGIRNYTRFGGHGVLVFDIDEGHRFVRRIPMPGLDDQGNPLNVKGICGNAQTARLYVSTIRELICVDLRTDEVIWVREFSHGCDRMSLSPDGELLYLPSLENDHWYVVNAITGEELTRVELNSRAHNTVFGQDGNFVYLAGLGSNELAIADVSSHQVVRKVGPFGGSIRPFTINGSQSLCFVNVNGLLGFEIGDLRSGEFLHRIEVEGYRQGRVRRHGCPSHGIAMTPDERQIWVTDGHNEALHVFDVTDLPPRQIDTIELREQPGWITFSIDGKTCWPSTGDVIDVESRRIVARLTDEWGRMVMSEKLLEIVFADGSPIAVGDQFGRGMQTEPVR